jgi:hypothetical protein
MNFNCSSNTGGKSDLVMSYILWDGFGPRGILGVLKSMIDQDGELAGERFSK